MFPHTHDIFDSFLEFLKIFLRRNNVLNKLKEREYNILEYVTFEVSLLRYLSKVKIFKYNLPTELLIVQVISYKMFSTYQHNFS